MAFTHPEPPSPLLQFIEQTWRACEAAMSKIAQPKDILSANAIVAALSLSPSPGLLLLKRRQNLRRRDTRL